MSPRAMLCAVALALLSLIAATASGQEPATQPTSGPVVEPIQPPPPPPPPVPPPPMPPPPPPPPPAAPAGITVVNSSYASLTLAGIFQANMQLRADGNADRDDVFLNNHVDFSLQRIRIFLKGHLLSPNLTYVFQGDAAVPGFALDMKLGYTIPEGKDFATTFYFGRFLPPFSLILPRPVSRLDAINYPLYIFTPAVIGNRQPFASTNSVGRMVGFLINQKLFSIVSLDLGVFNGYQRLATGQGQIDTILDDNDDKDFLVRAAVSPAGMTFGADLWVGLPASLGTDGKKFPRTPSDKKWENDTSYFLVLEAEISKFAPFKFMGEFVYGHQITRTATPDTDPVTKLPLSPASWTHGADETAKSIGAWFHLGYMMKNLIAKNVDLEAIARWDYYDPNIEVGHNAMMRVTVGPHLFLEQLHAQLRINYMANINDMCDTPGFGTCPAHAKSWGDVRHEFWIQAALEI